MEQIDVRDSCSWCHHLNSVSLFYCAKCGHQAHVARMQCNCQACQKRRREVESTGFHASPELIAALEGGESALTALAAMKKALREAQQGHADES